MTARTASSAGPRPLASLPKTHLHAHLDGSYPLAAVAELAGRRGVPFSVPGSFDSVWDFFAAYGTVPDLVHTHEDLAFLCRSLVESEIGEGVRYLEPAIEPQLYAPRLGDLTQVTRTMLRAFAEASAGTGLQVGALLTINTDQDEPIADELARVAVDHAGSGVTALGTAGFVEPAGLQRFSRQTRLARDAGLDVVSHAGQTGGPDSIREALDIGAARLSHGFRAVESSALVERLRSEGIVCDVCPTSNVALGLVARLADHPARDLIVAGVAVTLNADDALWFGQGITAQYEIARGQWHLSDEQLAACALAGGAARGMTEDTRRRLRADVATWLETPPPVS